MYLCTGTTGSSTEIQRETYTNFYVAAGEVFLAMHVVVATTSPEPLNLYHHTRLSSTELNFEATTSISSVN